MRCEESIFPSLEMAEEKERRERLRKQLNAWHLGSSCRNNNNKNNDNNVALEGAEAAMTGECNLCVQQSWGSIHLPPIVSTRSICAISQSESSLRQLFAVCILRSTHTHTHSHIFSYHIQIHIRIHIRIHTPKHKQTVARRGERRAKQMSFI